MSSKKLELASYDPRGLQGMGLSYATGVRGGDHINGYMISAEVLGIPEKLDPFVNEGKAIWTKAFQDLTAAIDAAGICLFTSLAPMGAPDYAAMVSAVTGMAIDGNELMRIGERIWTVQKLFNVRVGYTKSDDTLPDRLLTEPLKEGEPQEGSGNANRFSMNTIRHGAGIPRESRHRKNLKNWGSHRRNRTKCPVVYLFRKNRSELCRPKTR